MAKQAKGSLKRSKPNYIYSIVGVALVLLIMGVMGYVVINFNRLGKMYKEDVKISAYLRTANKDTITQIRQYIESQPYARNVEYIDKEAAKRIWNKDNNEEWANVLQDNPFPESIDFNAKTEYVNKDSLSKISTSIFTKFPDQITDLQYPKDLVNTLNQKAAKYGMAFLVIAILLCVIVIVSIDNTIKLAMFSNRFLIKTMQMVGATRWFIVKPMDIKAVINGLISAGIAIFILFGMMQVIENIEPEFKKLQSAGMMLILFIGMALIGVVISVYSTHRSVMKYLRMKLDDLY
jgi:cell division transport system permease protein